MPSKPEPITAEHFCIRCHHRWQGGLAHSYCGDCHRECQELKAALAQAEQERDALRPVTACVCHVDDGLVQEWVSKAREVAKSKGYAPKLARDDAYARGRADTLAQVTALIEKTIIAPSEHAVWRSLKVHIQHQLDAISVSPPQEPTEKERA